MAGSEAGHAFQSFNNSERYRKEANEDAWQKALAFFAQKLGDAHIPRSLAVTSAGALVTAIPRAAC